MNVQIRFARSFFRPARIGIRVRLVGCCVAFAKALDCRTEALGAEVYGSSGRTDSLSHLQVAGLLELRAIAPQCNWQASAYGPRCRT